MGGAASGGPSPAGGAADNVNISNPFDDVSPSPPPRGGPFPGGPHPPYPANTPPRPQGQGYSGQAGYGPYPNAGPGAPPDQYSYQASSGYAPATRPVYPPYSNESGAPVASPNNSQGAPATGQDPYNRYNMNTGTGTGYSPRPAYGGSSSSTAGPAPAQQPPVGPYPSQPDYYRGDQVMIKKSILMRLGFCTVRRIKLINLLPQSCTLLNFLSTILVYILNSTVARQIAL